MSRTVVATIIARVRVPDEWHLGDLSVDKNMPILMHHHELDQFSFLSTPFQPRVLTLAHSLKEEPNG